MRVARTITLAAVLALLASVSVTAQEFEPLPTAPPDLAPTARVAANTTALDDPRLNSTIAAAVRFATAEIEAKKVRIVPGLPSAVAVSREAGAQAEGGRDIIILHGSDPRLTVSFASQFPESSFLDIGQEAPCVTVDGRFDPSGTCAGGTSALPFNYQAVSFAEDQSGYLAGIIAAAASHDDRIGIIGGTPECSSCNRYIQGFELGARSLKPNIEITKAFLSDTDPQVGFTDAEVARTFAEAFIDVHQPDVLFPVARANTLPMLEAACDSEVSIIGSDLDLAATHPTLAGCVLTSATKTISAAVRESIFSASSRRMERLVVLDLNNGGVAVTPEWQRTAGLPVDLFTNIENATSEIRAGLIETCPEYCGDPDPEPTLEPAATDGEAEGGEAATESDPADPVAED